MKLSRCVDARIASALCLGLCALFSASACHREAAPPPVQGPPVPSAPTQPETPAVGQPVAPVEPAPLPFLDPVALWEHGQPARDIEGVTAERDGYLVMDLGESWTPYLFTDGVAADGSILTNSYRPTYLALARGELPDDVHGERARRDKYLELYGIAPTLSALRERYAKLAALPCIEHLDVAPLEGFAGLVTYSNNAAAAEEAARFEAARTRVSELQHAQHVSNPSALDVTKLTKKDLALVQEYKDRLPRVLAIDAMQKRLRCEGILVGRGKYLQGVMDWATHESLAEFERRHRIFSQGYLARESRVALTTPSLVLERAAVLRVLTERALHASAVLEDGSAAGATYQSADGSTREVPNLASQLEAAIVEAFGLQTTESTLAFLNGLGELPAGEHRFVAIHMPELPEYYAPEMELTLDYDRGDVWYDFPYDDAGKAVAQPVRARPQVTVSTLYNGQKIPLARYGTTIGGFRTEVVDGKPMWKYKDSPVGPRAWEEIVAAPVWIPPDSTPTEDLIKRNDQRKLPSDPEYVLNYHEIGPSYASAYGLVAAYHRTYLRLASGRIQLGADEGIRTHGSVDYMSIMRRHSHGCHRLHNHIALRLMSFVLAHRPHQRVGQRDLAYQRELTYKDKAFLLDIPQSGYTFKLETPLLVNVEEGNVLGRVKAPLPFAIPEWNPEQKAYVAADGTHVRLDGDQLVALEPPQPSAATPQPSSVPVLQPTAAATVPQPRAAATAPRSTPAAQVAQQPRAASPSRRGPPNAVARVQPHFPAAAD